MGAKTIILKLTEPKKHSVRYDAPEGTVDPILSSVYVSKRDLPKPFPAELEIAIAWKG
jgi:hypothetical protein